MSACLQYPCFACFGYSKLGEDEAEPEVVVAVVGRVVVTVRRAAVPGVVVPAATAFHAVRPTRG